MKNTNEYVISMKLPSLNEVINVNRYNRYAGNNLKQNTQELIYQYIKDMPRYEKPIKIDFHWYEGNKRRDLDNIASAKKFILDTMVKYGKLKDDNRKNVCAFTDNFYYGKEWKVILKIQEVENVL